MDNKNETFCSVILQKMKIKAKLIAVQLNMVTSGATSANPTQMLGIHHKVLERFVSLHILNSDSLRLFVVPPFLLNSPAMQAPESFCSSGMANVLVNN